MAAGTQGNRNGNGAGGEQPLGRVMCIGRSDCLGRAGVQGDAQTVSQLGGLPATVITMVCADDSTNAYDWVEMPPTIIVRQLERILRDLGVDCVKIGQLHSQETIDIITNTLERLTRDLPMVVSPVLVSADGQPRHSVRSMAALKRKLLVHTTVLAVSSREAELLTGMEIRDPDAMMNAAAMLLTLGARSVFVHGGMFGSDSTTDILVTEDDIHTYTAHLSHESVFGAKTALSAAIATGIAQGRTIQAAVELARDHLESVVPTLLFRSRNVRRGSGLKPGLIAFDGEELVGASAPLE